ncbi:NADH-quinone oxidoreductase subunit NuoE [Naumannella cuiyingiana]|uniref:NADH-quinone oxidoreductase subunit E n=1 Tax=Naumannella cuiyingiana TaxID=1347891 RepID=A0A7Z0D8C3_9ACTN|nr:NADH-quinone oxidoreductase subunit E [Naumannella cuiyingiana]
MSHFQTYFPDSGGYDIYDDDADNGGRGSLTEQTLVELREIAARYPQKRSALLPMLHLCQSQLGRITTSAMEACAEICEISVAEVSGVVTFYTMYKRKPVGKHLVGVCTTALCAIMGGDALLAGLQDHLGVGLDETTADGAITLEHVECNAACDYAPVMMVNWEFFDNMNPESAVALVDALRADQPVASPRGAEITSWREAERVLAGFGDGRADQGPAAGPESLLGLEIANERGWHAPEAPGRAGGPDADAGTDREEGSAK